MLHWCEGIVEIELYNQGKPRPWIKIERNDNMLWYFTYLLQNIS